MIEDFKQITIVGLGLIGGSFAKALKKKEFKGKVCGIDSDLKVIKEAIKTGVIDQKFNEFADIVSKTDLMILALPVGIYEDFFEKYGEYIKSDCIITDVGSVKSKAHKIIEKHLTGDQIFIGGHPMIGSEKSGFAVAKAHLFENAYYFVTAEDKMHPAITKIESLVEFIGAKAIVIEPDLHDFVVARTSHLPHINAVLMLNLLNESDASLINYVGGGFRDTTRIASSEPELWRDILFNNQKDMVLAIDDYVAQLNDLKTILQTKDNEKLLKLLRNARRLRKKIPKHLTDTIEMNPVLYIDMQDQIGMIANATGLLAKNNINISDIEIVHSRENIPGVLKIGFYSKEDWIEAKKLIDTTFYINQNNLAIPSSKEMGE